MLESKAYQIYYAFASREKAPKPKYVRKKADSDTSPKKKPVQATKGTRLKSKAKVAKPDKKKQPTKKPKAKGLAVLSEVALTEAEQLKLATKRSKTQLHNEETGTIPGVPDVPIYASKSDKESWGDSDEEDDDEDNFEDDDDINDDDSDDEMTESDSEEIPDPNKPNEEHDKEEEEYDDEFNIEEE
ncbi:hypothetical protein Tco_1260457 [Tanacetum coccineum]